MAIRKKGGTSPVHRIFVRIGALRRFHTLTQKTADLPVEVVWDRRRDERRDAQAPSNDERRQSDRRKKPPFTWETADFVVAEADAEETAQSKQRSKKS
jgi:hypothetical protein